MYFEIILKFDQLSQMWACFNYFRIAFLSVEAH